jgi:hypothetical protein
MIIEQDQERSDNRPEKSVDATAARKLTPQAERALAEAALRRAEIDRKASALPKEHSGRQGPEPTRYGDWECKGIASDF